jgi:hypothetical protein
MNLATLTEKRESGQLTKADFTLRAIRRRIEEEVTPYIHLSLPTNLPFPKTPSRWLSHYQYVPPAPGEWLSPYLLEDRFLLTCKLIDFAFLRPLLADTYGKEGGPCYDPVSLFLLACAAKMEGYLHTADFVKALHHPTKGPYWWKPTGVTPPHIPCQMTFTNFRGRINQQSAKHPTLRKYEEILQVLDWIFYQVGLVTFRFLATDGCLFPSAACYKGCAHHQGEACQHLAVEGLLPRIRKSLAAVLAQYPQLKIGKTYTLTSECPQKEYPKKDPHGKPLKRPKIRLFQCRFLPQEDQTPHQENPTLKVLGIEEKLAEYGLTLEYTLVPLTQIAFSEKGKDRLEFACPRLPKDWDARLGVQRDNHNSQRKRFVFGYNKVTTYSIEPELETAFPTWTATLTGNAQEGKEHRGQLEALKSIPLFTLPGGVHLDDSKADERENYKADRQAGYLPLIALNDRNDDLSREGLQKRGYDRNGRPFAACGLTAGHFQGFDRERGRLAFACGKHCPQNPEATDCPYQENQSGQSLHLKLKDNPRVFCEIPRASKRYQEIYRLRNLAENGNSTQKFDLQQLQHPKVYSLPQAQTYDFFVFCAGLFTKVADCVRKCSEAFREAQKASFSSSRAPPAAKPRGRPPKAGKRPTSLPLRPLSPALRSGLG